MGERSGSDCDLANTGLFAAEVYPDLPIATTWDGIYRAMLKRVRDFGSSRSRTIAAAAAASGALDPAQAAAGPSPGMWRVETIGAQLRDRADLHRRICAACGRTPGGKPLTPPAAARADPDVPGRGTAAVPGAGAAAAAGGAVPPADALLFVSGSHPARQVPWVDRVLPSSISLLRTASALRSNGAIPGSTSLWAVANPVIEVDASRTEEKVEAGAEVILTQPPLDWGAFERWWADAERRGLPSAAKLLIGFPALSSAANAAFWVALAGAGGSEGARRVVARFAEAEQRGKEAAAAFALEFADQQLKQLRAVPGLGGLHVMPLTPAARKIVVQLAGRGLFAPPEAGA